MTKALFTKLHDFVELRKNAAAPSSDSIDGLFGIRDTYSRDCKSESASIHQVKCRKKSQYL